MNEKPSVMSKIVPVFGELTHAGLGLQPKDLEMMKKDVNVIFHIAATIKFNEPLPVAIDMNVCGTQKVLNLAKKMPNLESFVHTSTAFCGSDQKVHEEKLYEWRDDPHEVIEKLRKDPQAKISVDPFPNTYCYSKRLTELLIDKERDDLPISIVRPSIVTPTIREPFGGWIDNYSTLIGIITGAANGTSRSGQFGSKERLNSLKY